MSEADEIVRKETISPDHVSQNIPADLKPLEDLNLTQIRFTTPEGTPMERWIFPALEECGGLLITTDDATDRRWIVIYGSGLPKDMRRIDVSFSAAAFHSRFKDFAIHGKGVIADPSDPQKGAGGWTWTVTQHETGEIFVAYFWLVEVFLRNSATRLLGHYNPGTEALYLELTGVQSGLWFELGNLSLDDPASAHRLIDNVVLLKDAQSILDAASAERRGRKPLAEITDDTLKLWSGQYDEAMAALEKEISNRTWRQLKRVVQKEAKKAFVRRAFPNIPDDQAARLADSTRISEVALRYTAWKCSQIEIGVGARRTLENLRQNSDKLNGVRRSRQK